MKTELDEKLVQAFPKLYKNRHGSEYDTCMAWGFETGDGWYELIKECSEKLEVINDKIEDPEFHIVAEQVKEKFGTLRFYVGAVPSEYADEIYDAIRVAEDKSETTCEVCGEVGRIRGKGWVSTLCDKHADERNSK